MGGNLLKDITRRHSTEEYFAKTDVLIDDLCRGKFIQKLESACVIPAYNSKESFGDADIVYTTIDDDPFSIPDLDAEFNPTRIIKNGEVTSFDYKELQVDLIHCKKEYFDYALSYFSYNDLGNFIGKLARYFGLSHGHKGLYLPLRESDGNLIESILVTTDHDATLRFVGLDTVTFHAGIETMEDVYRYVQSSPQFNPDSYKLENISAIGRMRDKKRESYRNFLKFNESYNGQSLQRVEDKTVFLELIFNTFPGVKERFMNAMERFAFKKAVREKFSGDIVKLITGLENKELGIFMKHLKALTIFDPPVIMYLTESQIRNNILGEFKNV